MKKIDRELYCSFCNESVVYTGVATELWHELHLLFDAFHNHNNDDDGEEEEGPILN